MHVEPGQFLADFNHRLFGALQSRHEHNWDELRAEHTDGRPDWMQPREGFDPRRAADAFNFVLARNGEICEALSLLQDRDSRRRLEDLLLFRVLGHRHVKLAANTGAYWAAWELGLKSITEYNTRAYVESYPRLLQNMFHRFRLSFEGSEIDLESILFNVVWAFFQRQYYLERPDFRVRPEPGDVVVDAGGCYGESALAFAASVGPAGRVYSFEMDPLNLATFRANLDRNPQLADRIEIVERAISDVPDRSIGFETLGIASRLSADGSQSALTESVDSLVRRRRLDRVDFIKMDIEGAELSALKGSIETIRRFQPKLAIAIYHKPDDFITLPKALRVIDGSYRLAIEHYTIDLGETVLYGSARHV
jgi:FkbM family methyltransferase